MSDLVKFKKGQSANLSSTAITPGQILVSTDTGEMHVDYDDNGTSKRVKIKDPSVATNYVSKSGDTMTGALYIDATNSSLPNMVSTDTYVRGLLGAKLSSSLSIPLIYCASQNNTSNGAGVSFTGKGLTIIGAGENGPSAILNNAAQKSGTTNGSDGNAMTPTTEELVLSSDTVISFYPGSKTDSYASQINTSGTFIGPTADAATIQSSLATVTYLKGNQGVALVNSTAAAGGYVTLLKSNSTNGYFTVANHGANFKLQYTAKTTVDSNTNSVTKSATLLDESGNASFPGTVTVGAPTANTHAATKAYVDNHTHTLSLATDTGTSAITLAASTTYKLAAGGSTYIFTTPPNTDTHYTTHLYAGSGSAANAATTNGNTKITVVDNSAVRNNVTIKGILGTDVSSDASGNISIGNGIAKLNQAAAVSSTEADNWQLIANGEMTGNNDINILFAVTDNYSHANGLLSLAVRCANNNAVTNQSASNGPRLEWISRHKDINPNQYRLRVRNYTGISSGEAIRCTWELEAYHHRRNYTVSFEVIQASGYSGDNVPAYTLHTDGPAVSSGGTLYTSRDVLPLGGTWESSSWNTSNAAGITIGEYGKCTTSTSGNIAIGGTGSKSTSATGSWAIAVGSGANSSGDNSLAVGNTVTASNTAATAVGYNNTASGSHATAVGSTNTAVGVALGYSNTASNSYTNAIGISNTASGVGSNAYGRNNTVSGENSYAIGGWNKIAGEKCFAIGTDNNLDSIAGNGGLRYMHRSGAIGCNNTLQCNTTSGSNTHDYVYAIGGYNKMRNTGIAIGCNNTISVTTTTSEEARRDFSVAIGSFNSCTQYNSYTLGYALQNNSNGAFVCGRQNKALTANTTYTASSTGDVFAVGNGYSQPDSSSATGYKHVLSNAFRVTYAGAVYARAAYKASGADYAEFIKEWWDGNPNNEDRVGYMVTIKNGKLYKANEGDYIIGITSGNPSVIGNADEDYFWMYERDEFNRIISEEVPDIKPKIDENGEFILDEDGKIIYEDSGNTIKRFKFREEYDPSLQDSYIERKDRPEWDYVGMRGIVPCRDDGTCEEGRFCKCGSDGIATKADTRGFDTYYVVERINDHVISVEVK